MSIMTGIDMRAVSASSAWRRPRSPRIAGWIPRAISRSSASPWSSSPEASSSSSVARPTSVSSRARARRTLSMLKVRLARARLETDVGLATELLEDASGELDQGLAELREIARGIHPAILGDRGLRHALDALTARMSIPVTIDIADERLPEDIEATAYYIVSEALTNVAKHAEATEARVTVRRDGAVLRCEVADDGRGGADASGGTGLIGLRDRAEASGGTLSIVSPPGRGTVVAA